MNFINSKKSLKKGSSRAKIFDYLLPPEKDFFSVASSTSTNYITTSGGIYFFFNAYFIEKKFEDNLSTDLQVHLNNGTNFPLNKAFNENMKEWLCYYDNDHTRFYWDIKEKIDFGHNPNVPWKAFQNRCQYAYTLVKIGYEKRDSSKPISDKSTYQKKGSDYVCDSFELKKKKKYYNSRINKSVEYDESDYCILRGNIQHGLETTPVKDPFKSAEAIAGYSLKYYKEHKTLVNCVESLMEKEQEELDFNSIKVNKKSETEVTISVYAKKRWYVITHKIEKNGQEICYFVDDKLILGRKYDLEGNYLYMFDLEGTYQKREQPTSGLETTPDEDPFKIKDFNQANIAIKIAIRYRKYEQSAEIFDFTDSDIRSIYRIYDANQSRLGLPPINNRKKDFRSAFDVLNKRSVSLNVTDKKRIEEIAEKIAIKNPIPQSKTKNEIENEYDCTDEVAYKQWEDEKNKLDEQSQLKEFAECFCKFFNTSKERYFTDWLKALIETPEGIRTFSEGENMLDKKETVRESIIVTKYVELVKVPNITEIINVLKNNIESARKEMCNG